MKLSAREQEIADQLSQDLRDGLAHYINRPSTASMAETMRAHMMTILRSYVAAYNIQEPIPEVSVSLNGMTATYKFYNWETYEEINLSDWLSGKV